MPLLGRLTALTIILAAAIIAVALIHRAGGPQPAQAATTAPAAPTGLTATPGDTKVTLKWNASIGASGYNVWRRLTATGSTWRQIAKTTTPSYTDTAVTNGTGYTYAVRAYNTAGQVSASSTFAYATPTASPAPAVPTGLTATAGDGTVTLDWADSTDNYTRYQVYQDDKLIADGPTASTYTVTGLTNGTTYAFRVSAGSTGRYSAWTAPVTATPTAPAPTPTPTPTPAPTGTVIWDDGVNSTGTLAAYHIDQCAPDRTTVVADPAGGTRRVIRMTVKNTDVAPCTPTENPRAQATSPSLLNEGDDVYVGFSILVPADFPQTTLSGDNWISIASIYGPPYNGSGPNSISMNADGNGKFYVRRNATYNYDEIWSMPLVRGKWVDFVSHYKLSQDPAVGFREQWVNTGTGWVQSLLKGQTRLMMKTLDASNNGGAQYSKVSLYFRKDIMPAGTVYFADHKIATTFNAAAPTSYSK